MGNPESYECHYCGHTWKHGHDGSHNCAMILFEQKQTIITELKLLSTKIDEWVGK